MHKFRGILSEKYEYNGKVKVIFDTNTNVSSPNILQSFEKKKIQSIVYTKYSSSKRAITPSKTTISKSAYDNKQACTVLKACYLTVLGMKTELFTEYRLISQTFTSSRICWNVFLIFPVQKTAASLEGLSSTQSCKAWPIVDPNNGASLGPWA